MRREIYDCDRCGKPTNGLDDRFFIVTERYCDAAGSMDDGGDHVDLCGKCAHAALGKFVLQKRDYALNKEVLDFCTANARRVAPKRL